MLHRILLIAVLAGAAAGLVATGVQATRLWPLILEAEKYEHAAAPPAAPALADATAPAAHAHPAWEPEDGIERISYTVLFNLLTGIGFALLLNGAMTLRATAGAASRTNAGSGALWGLAGFACFALAPAFGLPPLLPGSESAALLDRQLWWAATAVATAGGLGLIAFAPARLVKLLGALVLVAPHVVGAPRLDEAGGAVPASLAAEFAVTSLVAAALFWLVLGALSGWLQRRLA
ncbi:MAG: CbtA family protein [Proteobacteria bacterium]|nr:CbtA family protein [Pseudomonadota bacterium]